MIISLIGYRATGKSTVGKLLASTLALPFYDSDQFITVSQGISIAEIFEQQGEPFFRSLETDAVKELMKLEKAVIAWGGGVVLDESNRHEIGRSDQTVWLQASADVIFDRMHSDEHSEQTRPALTNLGPLKEIETNLAIRESFYRSCSDLVVQTDGLNVEEIVQRIVEVVRS